MHQLGIATSVLEAARQEAARQEAPRQKAAGHPGAGVLKVGLRIGEWSGVDPESLRFCFDAIVDVQQKVLSENDRLAASLRGTLHENGVYCPNFISSPGAGETMLLERQAQAVL